MNVLKYIEKSSDLTFEESAINEVDIAIFTILSYVIFKDNFKSKVLLKDKLKPILKRGKKYYKTLYRGEDMKKYLSAIIKSKRYNNIMISNYISDINLKSEKQFSAITYHLDHAKHLVLFRGTDRHLVGWKEDFNMSFSKVVPAQSAAKKYLNKMLLKHRGKFIVAGHSKGGNLAIYAAGNSNKIFRNKIMKIYNFDGPGFEKDTLGKYIEIENKIINYYPQDSVAGMALYGVGSMIFVASYKKRLQQHDILNWKVNKTEFHYTTQSKFSKFINEVLNTWFSTYNSDEKAKIFNDLFSILGVKEGVKLSDISGIKETITYLKSMEENYSKLNESEKKLLKKAVTEFFLISKKVYSKNK